MIPVYALPAILLRYYSYRAEKGKTGRMLALLGLDPTIEN